MKDLIKLTTILKVLIGFGFIYSCIGCKKMDKVNLPLAVNNDTIIVDTSAGVQHILVYAQGDWQVDFVDSINSNYAWISIDKMEGSGNGEVVFSYSRNLGASRSVTLKLTSGNLEKKIFILQNGRPLDFTFSQRSYTIPRESLKNFLPVVGKIGGDLSSVEIEYIYDDETVTPWITLDTLSKDGYTFTSLENDMGRSRSVRIFLTIVDGEGKELSSFVDINQSLSNAFLEPKYTSGLNFIKRSSVDTIILNTNIGAQFDNVIKDITYVDGNEWIDSVILTKDSLLIVGLRENNTGQDRTATLDLVLKSGQGSVLIDESFNIFQSGSSYQILSFDVIRQKISGSAGVISSLDEPLKAIRGIVISDAQNTNMETNPSLSFNKIDFEESLKTAYVQSDDGKYGFRLKFDKKADNNLARYSTVTISIEGLKLTKENNPGRYTISGITSSNIISQDPGNKTDVVQKIKSIRDISDDDVYTFVTMQDVSYSVPYGSFGNTNRGYIVKTAWNQQGITGGGYVDAIPTSIFDRNGDNLNLLVNTSSPWIFTDLTKNSGNISGIVTHSKLIRYGADGGNIGRYQVRPLDEHDLVMDKSPIAETIAEWNWMNNNSDDCVPGTLKKDGSGNILPFIGDAILYSSISGLTTGLGANPICHDDPNSKTIPNSAFQASGKYWNFTTNDGEGFIIECSTDGISASNVMLNFSIGGGSGSDASSQIPNHWNLEYSYDGTSYSTVLNSNFTVRPLTGWNLDRQYMNPGLINYSIKLPNSILNRSKVYIKIKARSDVYSTAASNGADAGHLSTTAGNNNIRFGSIAIKYIN